LIGGEESHAMAGLDPAIYEVRLQRVLRRLLKAMISLDIV
jgi:hypothetical protein